jgi:hypothetical protein
VTLRLLRVALVRQGFRFWALRLSKAVNSCPESDGKTAEASSVDGDGCGDAGVERKLNEK